LRPRDRLAPRKPEAKPDPAAPCHNPRRFSVHWDTPPRWACIRLEVGHPENSHADVSAHACRAPQRQNIERGATDPRASTLDAIQAAFDKAGVVFLDPGDTRGGGPGARLKASGGAEECPCYCRVLILLCPGTGAPFTLPAQDRNEMVPRLAPEHHANSLLPFCYPTR
jgi:hypothetical protein